MKTLLTLAKALSIERGGKTIAMDDVREACTYVGIERPFYESKLKRELKLADNFKFGGKSDAAAQLLATARNAKPMDLDVDVRGFLANMGGMGIEISKLAGHANPPAKTPEIVPERQVEEATSPIPEARSGDMPMPATGCEVARKAHEYLSSIVYGQSEALSALRNAICRLHLFSINGPRLALFLVGPPASGKTLIASRLTEALGAESRTLVVDFARFRDEEEGFGLTGLRKGWGGAQGGMLTGPVAEHPKTVVVIDNFDQAHPKIQDSLLPVFDSGFLRDDHSGRDVDFRETILVFTSSLGRRLFADPHFVERMARDRDEAERLVIQEIAAERTVRNGVLMPAMSPGMLSRLAQGAIVLLRPLGFDALRRIARKAVSAEGEAIARASGLAVAPPDDAVLTAAMLSLAPQVDARRMSGALGRRLFDPLVDALARAGEAAVPVPRRVEFALDSELARRVADLGNDAGLRQLVRRGRTLQVATAATVVGEVLRVTFSGGGEAKVPSVGDFLADGAIRLEVPDISFNDIHGHKWVKERLAEVAKLLKAAADPAAAVPALSRGMLLYGRPGTGKTMLARAFANECDLPFIALAGPQLLDLVLVREVFRRAREYAPAIVFIDEVDALGRRDMGGYVQHINQLLVEIDGFDTTGGGVFVIGATNKPERIDPALLRAGRMDIHLEVPALDREARGFFIDRILAAVPGEAAAGSNRERLLDYTAGMTGAELERVRREAALLAVRGGGALTEAQLIEAISTVKHGESVVHRRRADDREQVAYHEAGHAVCSAVLNPDVRIEQVTIVPRGDARGFVAYAKDDDDGRRYTVTEIREALAVCLAGRAAEIRKYGQDGIEAGAADDLQKATSLCYKAIAHWGMDPQIGPVSLDGLPESIAQRHGEKIMARVSAWLTEVSACAARVMDEHWESVEALAQRLLKEETVDGRDAVAMAGEAAGQPSPCRIQVKEGKSDE